MRVEDDRDNKDGNRLQKNLNFTFDGFKGNEGVQIGL